ncbi:MAG: hypothetical protein WB791_01965 [Waddliaceae bacterium]
MLIAPKLAGALGLAGIIGVGVTVFIAPIMAWSVVSAVYTLGKNIRLRWQGQASKTEKILNPDNIVGLGTLWRMVGTAGILARSAVYDAQAALTGVAGFHH